MATPLPFYPHRHNKNGTYDSICLKCFATVATAQTEPELAFYNRRHICDPLLLAERHLFVSPHSKQSTSSDLMAAPSRSNN
jgi:hypothetical protein